MRDYQFWVIRYVPDSVRGEFVNIGLVVGGSDRDWAFRRVTRLSRARALGGFADAAESWLKRFEVDFISEGTLFAAEGLARPQGRTDLWIEELRRRMQNAIQISRPRPVVGRSAAEVADLLYARLIVDPPLRESSTARFRMANTLESAFTNLGVVTNLDIKRRVLARTGNPRARRFR
jgi:hypothetical protein